MTLSTRIEQAGEGSEALDLEIARIMDTVVMRRNFADTGNEPYTHWRYTTSLDAAMTLVPDEWSIGLGDLRGYDPPLWRAHLRDHRPESLSREGYVFKWVEGNTTHGPALALCAAALRARGL